MDIYYIASCWVCIAYIYLGVYIYRADPRHSLNRMFLFFNCSLAVISICNLAMNITTGKPGYFFWYLAAALFWGINAGLVLNLSIVLARAEDKPDKYRTYAVLYLPVVIIMILEIFILPDLYYGNFTLYNIIILSQNIFYFGYPLTAIIIVNKWGKRAIRLREKKQASIIVTTGLITMLLCFLTNVDIHIFGAYILPDISHILNFIFALAIWYAIHKYRLINLKAIVSTENVIARVTELIFIIDDNDRIVWMNNRCEELLGYRLSDLNGRNMRYIMEEWTESGMISEDNMDKNTFLNCRTINGEVIPLSIQVSGVLDTVDETAGYVVICRDMTLVRELQNEIAERKEKEGRLKYMSLHDSLTSLFNRRCFEQEMVRLEGEVNGSCGIAVCDVDGLKFVNDTMGHNSGDTLLIKAAEIITEAFRPAGTVYRIGGDEFAVLLPSVGADFIKEAEKNIKETVRYYNAANNDFYMSISIGFAVKAEFGSDILETFKQADNNMYREKLSHIKSTRSSMIQGLLKLLEVRDFITEGHAERMKELVVELGEFIGLPEHKIVDLRLLAQFHDIGKVGIPDSVLFKSGKLDAAEETEMQRHSEIGYRISKSIPELVSIAELILKHHERWDGKGYPLGIKGLDIPMECRILAIIDAYDAMTHNRPYRNAMTEAAAIDELKTNSGSQFDSRLVEEFIELLNSKSYKPT